MQQTRQPRATRVTSLLALLVALVVAATAGLVATAPPAAAASGYPLTVGSTGWIVKDVQQRLRWAGLSTQQVTGTYTAYTARVVRHFQEKNLLPITGTVNGRTHEKLRDVTWRKGVLPKICRTGKVICIDKTQKLLRYLVDNKVQISFDTRFGAPSTPTREGKFKIYRKSRHHVSSLFGSRMPFAMFFSGGQAIHYSPDFVKKGYDGASHGCVNVRNWDKIERLFDRTPLGRTVYIYR